MTWFLNSSFFCGIEDSKSVETFMLLQLPHKATPLSVETIGVTPELCSAAYGFEEVLVLSMLRVFLTSGERYARQFVSRRFFVQLFSEEFFSRCTVRF